MSRHISIDPTARKKKVADFGIPVEMIFMQSDKICPSRSVAYHLKTLKSQKNIFGSTISQTIGETEMGISLISHQNFIQTRKVCGHTDQTICDVWHNAADRLKKQKDADLFFSATLYKQDFKIQIIFFMGFISSMTLSIKYLSITSKHTMRYQGMP